MSNECIPGAQQLAGRSEAPRTLNHSAHPPENVAYPSMHAIRTLLFVGQAPGSNGLGPDGALAGGDVGNRMCKLLGVTPEGWTRFHRTNLNARWNGKQGKGDCFDYTEGVLAARALFRKADEFVLLGRAAATCFGFEFVPLTVMRDSAARFLLFPHPSGVNHWWNCPVRTARAAQALREFVHGKGRQ